jgi:hypothetical protein
MKGVIALRKIQKKKKEKQNKAEAEAKGEDMDLDEPDALRPPTNDVERLSCQCTKCEDFSCNKDQPILRRFKCIGLFCIPAVS